MIIVTVDDVRRSPYLDNDGFIIDSLLIMIIILLINSIHVMVMIPIVFMMISHMTWK